VDVKQAQGLEACGLERKRSLWLWETGEMISSPRNIAVGYLKFITL